MRKVKERENNVALGGLTFQMRPYHTVLLLLLLLGVILTGVPQTSASPSSGFTAKVARSVWITAYYTQVRDTVLINNTGGGAIGYLDFKISRQEYSSLFSMSAFDSSGRSQRVMLLGAPLEQFAFYRVMLSNPLAANQIGSVIINRYLLFYGSSYSQTASLVSLSILLSPTILLLNPISKANFTAHVPAGTTAFFSEPLIYTLGNATFDFTKNTGAHTISGNLTQAGGFQPDTVQPIKISFSADPGPAKGANNVYFLSAVTTLNLGDTLRASTRYVVYDARGFSGIGVATPLMIMMPSTVENPITASDFTGDLTAPTVTGGSGNPVNVTFPLRYDLTQNQTYTFTLNYQLKPDSVLTKKGDAYVVNLTSISPYIPFTLNTQLRLIAPYGSTALRTVQIPTSQGNNGGSDFVEFDLTNSTSLVNQNIIANFNYAWYWGFIKPWFYTSFVYVIGLLFLAVYLNQRPVSVTTAPAAFQDVKKFCDLYDEKTALGVEAQGLEESLRRGKIAKPLYDKRLLEIDSRRANQDRQLGELSRAIRQSAPRYGKNLDQVELLEAELRTVNATVKDLQRQYAARKVSRRVYDDLMYTYEGRLRKIQGRIDSLVINLREGR